MSRQNENSVLVSLRELRNIEDDRLRTEAAEVEQRKAAEARARQEAERIAQEAAEARVREAAAAERAVEEARRREADAEKLRLLEAERRARIQAEAQIEMERLRLQAEGVAAQPSSARKVVYALGGMTMAIVASLVYLLGVYLPERQRVQAAATEQREAALRAQAEQDRKALEARLDRKETELRQLLTSVKDRDQKAKLEAEIAEVEKQRAQAAATSGKPKGSNGTRTPPRTMQVTPTKTMEPMSMEDDPLKNNPLNFR